MSAFVNLKGCIFGRLTVVRRGKSIGVGNRRMTRWLCKCACGTSKTMLASYLRDSQRTGRRVSCGCWKRELQSAEAKARFTTHGLARKNPGKATEYKLWARAKTRAKRDGAQFDMAPTDIVIPEVCPVLGIKLNRTNTIISDDSPALDRVVNSLGYVLGNIQVISWRANRIKNDATVEELERVLAYAKGGKA